MGNCCNAQSDLKLNEQGIDPICTTVDEVKQKNQVSQGSLKNKYKNYNGKNNNTNNSNYDIFINLKNDSIYDYYKVGDVLGVGTFGTVNKVIHIKTGIVRAMKTVKIELMDQNQKDSMYSEMIILQQLDHPNILSLLDLYRDNDNFYLITELFEGKLLFDILQTGPIDEINAAKYMKQILSAVHYCHLNQIMHRDLKPENLIFSTDSKETLKIIDFGSATEFQPNIPSTERIGTPYYIAPEVLNRNYDQRCDIWSCGIILYTMLCGYPLFRGSSNEKIFESIQNNKIKFLKKDWDTKSLQVKSLIKKMLNKDPNKRISVKNCLENEWIIQNNKQTEFNKTPLNNLANFNQNSKFKQTILLYISQQIVQQKQKTEIEQIFRQLDSNGDGILSEQELIIGYTKILGDEQLAKQIVKDVIQSVDINNSQKVDFSEFLVGCLNKEQFLSQEIIDQTFQLFDKDNNGSISKKEFEDFFGEVSDAFWQQIQRECKCENSEILYKDFVNMLQHKSNQNSDQID